ncbi:MULTISPECIES: NTP transferase domain-containing protein [Chitinophaga]|uniref:NTP transferase domain-containing protein n=1 Tax=Chitinophaga TaxID=79328 RepID=UPI000DC02F99|nr:NTP transferase domain-containing protein [Chitinophaga ginsengisegetis]MDR6568202.1 MurNAc alpha-1-phosphate uridylyltransferase [Chitinophaga ginsengisegetis]MDR6647243.1 MurNAc alpha-1-phosphate uridylyltransferase [Chitinophaga ginsengisegetis]MDR6653592.1 MurNAc alpha-1-phosphate uridylyltransferase [Chitinophaga ginsengisegetis]
MINYALIMAAGRGLRMMPLTKDMTKSMIKVHGETLISKSISQIRSAIPSIAITVGHMGADLAKHVIEQGVSMVFNTNTKGNAWWIFNTLAKFINEPVLVLTCDNVVKLDIHFLYSNYAALGYPLCMVVPVKPVPGIEGDFISGHNNIVTSLNRKVKTDIYCSGIQLLNPFLINEKMNAVDDFYELWQDLIENEDLYYSATYPHEWYSVNSIEQLNELEKASGGSNF